jgi:prophage regulatory protein
VNAPALKIIKLKDVIELTGLSRSTIWRLERQGNFPQRVHLGERSMGWLEEEVDAWLNSRPRGISNRHSSPGGAA